MHKKLFLIPLVALAGLVMTGCFKNPPADNSNCVANNTGVPTAAEVASVQAYLNAHAISATQDPGGFFYIILNPGTGANPSPASTVTVKYTGSLENGNVFDQNLSGAVFPLQQLILGWQKGLPLIKKGGSIKLFLPPSLGYGCQSVGSIPPGSNLIFSIDLVDVQ